MNSPVISDTSAFVSLASVTDQNHKIAIEISKFIQKSRFPLIIPGEIFTETINILGKKIDHETAIKTGRKILRSEAFIITETTPEIRFEAFKKFQKRPQSVSFTDCLVMTFADEFETKSIFSFDKTFKKNGYIRLGIDIKLEI